MIPTPSTLFEVSFVSSRQVFMNAIGLAELRTFSPAVSEGGDLSIAIEDLSGRVAPEVFRQAIQKDPRLAEEIPVSERPRAIALIRNELRVILKGYSDLIQQRQPSVDEQIKQVIMLSSEAIAHQACERLRLELENVLLRKRNEELQAENKALAKKADFDFLTGLPNRGALEKRLHEEVARATRTKKPLCVLMFDLDRFKEVNTEYGHIKGGDAVLRILGHRFMHGEIGQKIMRDSDFVGRYGGDEIIIILPDADAEGAKIVAHRIVEALERDPVFIDVGQGQRVKADVGASIGIGIFNGKGKDPMGEKMCIDADQCLKICKGEDADKNGVRKERRGQIAVNGEVFTHEEVKEMIRQKDATSAQASEAVAT